MRYEYELDEYWRGDVVVDAFGKIPFMPFGWPVSLTIVPCALDVIKCDIFM